jgi:hypothetical protein
MTLLFNQLTKMTDETLEAFVRERRIMRQKNKQEIINVKRKSKGTTTRDLARELGIPEDEIISLINQL